jgi:hypothetical protein
MRELLIRYLLGELEPHEHDAVQRQLAESPELRRELAHLRTCFAASLESDEDPDGPPRGLAERTATRVSESDSYDALPNISSSGAAISEACDPPAGPLGWSLADLAVAGGVILAVSMLLFPAVRESREGTWRNICQENQRELGNSILMYAENNGGIIPPVHPGENAGSFVMQLLAQEYANAQNLRQQLVCPGGPKAQLIRDRQANVVILTSRQLDQMQTHELLKALAWMSPTYAYRFGYIVDNRRYQYITTHGPATPILSDAPGINADGMSDNHCGIVQILYSDGHVEVSTSVKLPGSDDDMFRNLAGDVDVGLASEDAVLGASEATPKVFLLSPVRRQTGLKFGQ